MMGTVAKKRSLCMVPGKYFHNKNNAGGPNGKQRIKALCLAKPITKGKGQRKLEEKVGH